MRSLRARVLLSAIAVLVLFVLLTGVALEQAFRDSAYSAREERLLAQIYLLMAAAESVDGVLKLPDTPLEPRLGVPDSGLYGAILDSEGNTVWRSASMLGLNIPLGTPLTPGQRHLDRQTDEAGHAYLVQRFGARWATGTEPIDYTFTIAEDMAPFLAEVAHFRSSLAGWLGAMSLFLLTSLLLILHWGLAPLRQVATEVSAIESGKGERIHGDYPVELRALTGNLNALLAHERAQHGRLNNALADLAHSLKTPLAVMRTIVDDTRMDPEVRKLLGEQVTHANDMVDYQLQRARSGTGSAAGLALAIPLDQLARRLVGSLHKLHMDKGIVVELAIPHGLSFRGAEGDLMEVLGNLLDNAYKWSLRRVRVTARRERKLLRIRVEDDGTGISPEQIRTVLERGARADSDAPGHGIGLAVVRDVCEAYGGKIELSNSPLGGVSAEVQLNG